MVEITYQMVLSTLQTLSIMVGIGYYIMTLRNQNKSRQAQLFMQLYDKLMSEDIAPAYNKIRYGIYSWDGVDDYLENFDPIDYPEKFSDMQKIIMFYEAVGVLAKRGLIDVTLIDDLISGGTLDVWYKLEPMILELRKRWNYPQFQEFHEYLANEIRKIVEQQHPDYVGIIGTRDMESSNP